MSSSFCSMAFSLPTIVHTHLPCQTRRGRTARLCGVPVKMSGSVSLNTLCLLRENYPPCPWPVLSVLSSFCEESPTHPRLTHPAQQPIQRICPSWLFVGDDGDYSYLAVCCELYSSLGHGETTGVIDQAIQPTVSCSVVVGEDSPLQHASYRY